MNPPNENPSAASAPGASLSAASPIANENCSILNAQWNPSPSALSALSALSASSASIPNTSSHLETENPKLETPTPRRPGRPLSRLLDLSDRQLEHVNAWLKDAVPCRKIV